jgi:hypothetical protein
MRWPGHVARLGEERKVYRLWWESSKERAHLEDQGVDRRMGSEWILTRLVGECRVDPVGSGKGPVADSCEYGDVRVPAGSGAYYYCCCSHSGPHYTFAFALLSRVDII